MLSESQYEQYLDKCYDIINQKRTQTGLQPLHIDYTFPQFESLCQSRSKLDRQSLYQEYGLYCQQEEFDFFIYEKTPSQVLTEIFNQQNQVQKDYLILQEILNLAFEQHRDSLGSDRFTHVLVYINITDKYKICILVTKQAVTVSEQFYDSVKKNYQIIGWMNTDQFSIYQIKLYDLAINFEKIIGPNFIRFNPNDMQIRKNFEVSIPQNLLPHSFTDNIYIEIYGKANVLAYYYGSSSPVNHQTMIDSSCKLLVKLPFMHINDTNISDTQSLFQSNQENQPPANQSIFANLGNPNNNKRPGNNKIAFMNKLAEHNTGRQIKCLNNIQIIRRTNTASQNGVLNEIIPETFDEQGSFGNGSQNLFAQKNQTSTGVNQTKQIQQNYIDQNKENQPNKINNSQNLFQQSQYNQLNQLFPPSKIVNPLRQPLQQRLNDPTIPINQTQNQQIQTVSQYALPNYNNYQQQQQNNICQVLQTIPINQCVPLQIIQQPQMQVSNVSDFKLFSQGNTKGLNLNFLSAYQKPPASTQIPSRFTQIKNLSDYNPLYKKDEEEEVDSNAFKDPLSVQAKQKIQLLDKLFMKESNGKEQFSQLYNVEKFSDVALIIKGRIFASHKAVLISISPHFKEVLENYPTNIQRINLPDNLDLNAFSIVFKFMYFQTIEDTEMQAIDIKMARLILIIGLFLRMSHLLQVLIIHLIIPKMNKESCISFLKDFYKVNYANDPEIKPILCLMNLYLIDFFANNSKEILDMQGQKELILQLRSDLIFKLVNQALSLCKEDDLMSDLLSILISANFGKNVIEILNRISKYLKDYKSFDRKYIYGMEEVFKLKQDHCYETNLNTPPPSILATTPHCKCSQKENQQRDADQAIINEETASLISHEELFLRYKCSNRQKVNNGQSAPTFSSHSQISQFFANLNCDYQFILELKPDYRKKLIITQVFRSQQRKWGMYVEIDDDQNISIYVQDRGPNKSRNAEVIKCNFTSCLFKLQIFEEKNACGHDNYFFYSFANDQSQHVGLRNIFNIKHLNDQSRLNINVWIIEYTTHACALHYISQRFKDLLQALIIDQRENEKSQVQIQSNNKGTTSEQKKTNSEKKRYSERLIENYLISDCKKIAVHLTDSEEKESVALINQSKHKVNLLDSAQTPMKSYESKDPFLNTASINNLNKSSKIKNVINIMDTQENNNNNNMFLQTGSQNQLMIDPFYSQKKQQNQKMLSFYDMNTYDFYYLLTSDLLNIDNENYIVYFLYRYAMNKIDTEIGLILRGLRFQFVDLRQLLDLARDHVSIKHNKYFRKKMEIEINRRMQSSIFQNNQNCQSKQCNLMDHPRKAYISYVNSQSEFSQDLINWLIESDHHEGFRLEINTLKNILKESKKQIQIIEYETGNIKNQFSKLKEENFQYMDQFRKRKFNQSINMEKNHQYQNNNVNSSNMSDNQSQRILEMSYGKGDSKDLSICTIF